MKPIEKYFPILKKSLEQYEKDHPHWQIDMLVSVIKWGINRLKYNIEEVHESKITWNNPFLELHYPIGWSWKRKRLGDAIAPGGHIFGRITLRNTATKELANRTLSRIMANQFYATALANATNWAWYEKRKNYYLPRLPIQLSAELDTIDNKQTRRERFDDLVRPFSCGVQRVDFDAAKFRSGTRVAKRVRKKLSRIKKLDIEWIRINGEIDGKPFDAWLVFEIHPLIADYDKKQAYHPIVVGLGFTTRMEGGKILEESPAEWPQSEREKFWNGLLSEIEKLKVKLIPKSQNAESVILPVNTKLKIPAEWWCPENRSATMKLMADIQGQVGEIMEFAVGQPEQIHNASGHPACKVCGLIHDAAFTQIKVRADKVITLGGVLPDIVAAVHRAQASGLPALSTKDAALIKVCGSYKHPCKAFDDLNRRDDYKILFNRKRGFISLRRAFGDSPE